MKKISLLAATLLLAIFTHAQTTSMVWAKNLKYSFINQFSVPTGFVIDNLGNYYVTGYFSGILDMDPGPGTYTLGLVGSVTVNDVFLAKYTANGNLLWAKSFGSTSYDESAALHLINDRLYVAGHFDGTTMDIDPGPGTYTVVNTNGGSAGFVATFDTTGTLQSGFAMPSCPISSIKADNAGNIYIGGQFSGIADLDPGPGVYSKTSTLKSSTYTYDLFYGKYTAAGSMVWANTKGTTSEDNAYAVAIDPVTGNIAAAGNTSAAYVALASPTGTLIKEATMGLGIMNDVVYDTDGNFYFAGVYSGSNDFDWSTTSTYSLPVNTSYNLAMVIKYTAANTFSWAKRIDPVMSINNSYSPVINLDNNKDILITGREAHAGSQSWLYFAKLDHNNGSVAWRNDLISACYAGPNWNGGTGIVYSPLDGTVLVTGTIGGSNNGSSTPCSFDADPGSGVYTLNAGAGNGTNMDVFMGKYGNCAGAPATLAAITGSTMQCAGATAIYSISPVSGANSYVWSIPNGWTGSSSTNTISVVTGTLTSATISVSATNSCGTSTLQSLSVQVDPLPAQPSVITGLTNLCGASSQSYSVAAMSGVTSYSWALPGSWSGTSTTNTIQVNPGTTSGILSVSAINSCGNGPAQNLNIVINALPTILINGNSTLCSGSNLTLTATGAVTYTWSTSSNSSSVTVSPVSATIYTVTGTAANGCENTAAKSITVNALPSVSINGPAVLCAGSSIDLTGSGATSYTWSTSANTNSITVSPVSSTIYSVTGADVNGCKNTATRSITVNALPLVSINGVSSLCTGNTTTLNAAGATTYTWNNSSNSASISVSPAGNTTYTLAGTDVNGCMNTAAKTLTVNALPSVSINGASSVCAGSNTALSATGATTYTWSTSSNNSNITVSPVSTTVYSVTGTDINGCNNTGVKTITVNALPSVSISATSTLICTGESTTLNALGANSYTWSTGATGTSDIVSPTASTGYTLSGTDMNNCSNSAVVTVSVSLCTGLSSLTNENLSVQLYPNPAGNELFIRSNETIDGYIVMDVTGKIVAESLGLNTLKASLDLRAYSSGIYVAIIYTGKSLSKLKFVKE